VNARSFRNKLDDIQTQTTLVNYVDIVAITDSWLYPQETNLFNLPNYSAHHSLRLVNNNDPSRGGGVVLFVKEGMNAIVINYFQNNFNTLHVKISKRSVSIHVILCYSPNLTLSGREAAILAERARPFRTRGSYTCRLTLLYKNERNSRVVWTRELHQGSICWEKCELLDAVVVRQWAEPRGATGGGGGGVGANTRRVEGTVAC